MAVTRKLAVILHRMWLDGATYRWRMGIEALAEAIARYGAPEIMNKDQGSQFTTLAFTGLLKEHGIRISMDGSGFPSPIRGLFHWKMEPEN